MIKVLLFDNDGVLAHTEELFFKINTQVFTTLGIPYTREDFINHTFITNLGTSGFMQNQGCTEEQIKHFKTQRNALWTQAILDSNTVDPEAENIFKTLKQEYKIGIVTNTDHENFARTHHSSQIPEIADFVVVREDYDKGKPEPDAYLKALEIANCKPDHALVIEDSPRGIVAAKAAGVKVVVIPNKVINNIEIPETDFRIDSLSELPSLLKDIK